MMEYQREGDGSGMDEQELATESDDKSEHPSSSTKKNLEDQFYWLKFIGGQVLN